MKRLITTLAVLATFVLWPPVAAQADFRATDLDVTFTNADGSSATQAGSHPFAMTTEFLLNRKVDGHPDGNIKEVIAEQLKGFVGDSTSIPRCSTIDFLDVSSDHNRSNCADNTAVGATITNLLFADTPSPVYNLEPPPGVTVRLGFVVIGLANVFIDIGVKQGGDYNVVATASNIPTTVEAFGSTLQLWGNPADPRHDPIRGKCLSKNSGPIESNGNSCPVSGPVKPFLTLPGSCTGPAGSIFKFASWQEPTNFLEYATFTHDYAKPPSPQGFTGCGKLGFGPTVTARPTTKAAQSPSGLDFSLDVQDEGLTNPEGLAQSNVRKAEVTLPEGFSTNPSLAEGLNVCTEADLARETLSSDPGVGCPNESKIGTVEVETPLLDENVNGSLFIAKPFENPFGSLLALYMVIKNPKLGIVIKQALKVEHDPVTGRITTVADDLPQLPFSHFRLHFREGTRSPLASPPGCGTYSASAVLTPWSGGAPITTSSAFSIISGPESKPCPTGATPPFHPELSAGTINNAAGRYSPFNTRISRADSEQEITNFSIKLPPGVIGKLAGIPFCSDAAIAAAKARTGPHGGSEEINAPSCPKASEVGRSLAGAGVGPSLAYAPGKIYLAGPYNGSSLSLVSITAAKVGPFDLGNVVVRFALKINPETAEVFVDATGSDPIPHIIKGIPLHLRDIRAYVDRPQFVLNPTSCERTSTASTVLGSGLNFGSSSDDVPVTVTSPFQAADCASLGFGPKLELSLKGQTKRGGTPAFKAVLTARPGDANIGAAQVTLPHSEFLEQAHIKTICTRAQFKEGAHPGEKCPPQSVYGYAKAVTPILDQPIEGPVYLRSSSHNLPDLVAAMHNGQIDINLVGRIDSVGNGQIRNTFEEVPDAPVTKFTLTMQGGKKGLLVNSTNLCKRTNKALADFTGQNGKPYVFKPVLKPLGCKAKKQKRSKRQR